MSDDFAARGFSSRLPHHNLACDDENPVRQHPGMRRRRLQFKESIQGMTPNQPAQNPSDTVVSVPFSQETPLHPNDGRQKETGQHMHRRNMSSSKNTRGPSGIGLHLNSIFSARSDAIIRVSSAQRVGYNVFGNTSIPSTSPYSNSNVSSETYVTHDTSASADGNPLEIPSSMVAGFGSSTLIIKPATNLVISNPVEEQSASGNKRDLNEIDGGSDEFKLSPQKKRKKVNDDEVCKRCNCKKSRCLKLYCDCFASGIYCGGSCTCQECYNQPEHVHKVTEARQQIESRDPDAFSKRNNETSTSLCVENGTQFASSSSVRHKRGCNCKKSQCSKKYCECFQASVGCSDGCRCEGCKNVYGRKGEYDMSTNVLGEESATNGTEQSFVEKSVASNIAFRPNEISTPLTPALQPFNEDGSESQSHCGNYFQSPDSDLSCIPQYMMSPGSSIIDQNTGMSMEIAQEIRDVVSPALPSYYGTSELDCGDLSTFCHQQGNLQNPQDWTNNSRTSSLKWRGSLNTRMVQISGAKLHELADLDGKFSDIMQDDTPDILKDRSAHVNAVKVSSPNKKRISPPHPRQEFGSFSSVGAGPFHKFTLVSVPTFPPLNPCNDSKSTIPQWINDPQNHTNKNQ